MINLRFQVKRTSVVFSLQSSSPFNLHQWSIALTILCISLISEGRSGPRTTETRSSAKPWDKSLSLNMHLRETKTELTTRFQSNGERTPPWGVPLVMYLISVIHLRENKTLRLPRRLMIQLIIGVEKPACCWAKMMLWKVKESNADLMSTKQLRSNSPLTNASSILDTRRWIGSSCQLTLTCGTLIGLLIMCYQF